MNKNNWMDQKVSLYSCHADNKGRAVAFGDVLLNASNISHTYYDLKTRCVGGPIVDRKLVEELRSLNKDNPLYPEFKTAVKSALQCYTPAALLASKKKGGVIEITRTGVMQLDFDHADIHEYDIEELKRCVFSLPFIGYCGLSCSGDGFYALALIAEPDRLSEYAEHCFEVLATYGIKADTSKGKKIENLRYLSYDPNMLIRDNPQPLRIARFKAISAAQKNYEYKSSLRDTNSNIALVKKLLIEVNDVQIGNRWHTVQRVAYTLGGLKDPGILSDIKKKIQGTFAFHGVEDKYTKCAEDCFNEGLKYPLNL
jgi:hypothetical protein